VGDGSAFRGALGYTVAVNNRVPPDKININLDRAQNPVEVIKPMVLVEKSHEVF
jgi:hypothetical protein